MWKRKGDFMKAVYEELNGNSAVFIVDDIPKTYHLPLGELPADAQVGDVFAVKVAGHDITLLEKLPHEREARLKSARAKREALLKRKKLP